MPVVDFEIRDKVAFIILNRPEARNAVNSLMCARLSEIIDSLQENSDLNLIVLSGKGQAFSAGADLRELGNVRNELEAQAFFNRLESVFQRISNLKIPVLAAINGAAIGAGLDLALSADMRICTENAKFGVPALKLGIAPTMGLTIRLKNKVGSAACNWIIWSAKLFNASDALRLGVVSEICADKDFGLRVDEMVNDFRSRFSYALSITKKTLGSDGISSSTNDSSISTFVNTPEFRSRSLGILNSN